MQEICALTKNNDFETGQGRVWEADVREDNIQAVIEKTTLPQPLRLVVERGQACFRLVSAQLLKRLGSDLSS